jgi:glutamate synthase (ferredoxin)
MDMVIELLLMTGRSLPEVMMMVVPEAWEKHQTMSDDKKHYDIYACIWSLGMACLYSVY